MQDNNLPNQPNQQNSSYVDDYQPPQDTGGAMDDSSTQPPPPAQQSQPPQPVAPASDDLANIDQSTPVNGQPEANTQSLETQNIFDLLGASDGSDEEKEKFLDELQEVIWDDFLENDADLLLTEEESKKLAELRAKGETTEIQEEILEYLESLIPDLEEVMMDKALELKEDMVYERITGMKEFHSGNQANLDKIAEAEKLISENKWADAAVLLNKIK